MVELLQVLMVLHKASREFVPFGMQVSSVCKQASRHVTHTYSMHKTSFKQAGLISTSCNDVHTELKRLQLIF